MLLLVVILLFAAVGCALARAFNVSSSVDLGWLALACLFAGVWLVPACAAAF